MASGSPGNTRAKRGRSRMKTPVRRPGTPRRSFECPRCTAPVSAKQRRATVAGRKICWPCAEPYAWRLANG